MSKQCTGHTELSAKALPVKYQVTAHRMWQIAKIRFVTLLSIKVLDSLEKSFMVVENGAVCSTNT